MASRSVGIIGMPNVGKSTLFNALTRTQLAQAANFPFCTIDPNTAKVAVRLFAVLFQVFAFYFFSCFWAEPLCCKVLYVYVYVYVCVCVLMFALCAAGPRFEVDGVSRGV